MNLQFPFIFGSDNYRGFYCGIVVVLFLMFLRPGLTAVQANLELCGPSKPL